MKNELKLKKYLHMFFIIINFYLELENKQKLKRILSSLRLWSV